MSEVTRTQKNTAQRVVAGENSPELAPPPSGGRWKRWCLVALSLVAAAVATWRFWPRDYGPEPVAPKMTPTLVQSQGGAEEARKNLEWAIQISHDTNARLAKVHDYTGRMTKRERYSGALLPEEEMVVKVRETPFSVYLRNTAPESKLGQEAIYVAGRNDGKLVAHSPGIGSFLGRINLNPTGWLAMRDNLHPITDVGLRNLIRQLLEMADKQRDYLLRCQIEVIEDAELHGRPCRKLYIRSQAPSSDFRMAVAQIYFDKEWEVPVHYEAYDFPPGDDQGEPVLMEQYSWKDLKFNVGLTDKDFDPDNPEYQFP